MNKFCRTFMNILITGSSGFLGRHLTPFFKGHNLFLPSHKEYDLTRQEVVEYLISKENPDIIINLAAVVGGIGYNKENPATLFYRNAMIGINLIHAAYENRTEKFVQVGTICAYPKYTPIPFKEEDLWNGYPEETNAPYGIAKKSLLVMLQAYRKQYGFNGIYLLPVNLYGPGDNFNPNSSHVIPALIRRFVKARANNSPEVIIWGTGKATREFLYVEDCAKAIYLATENYNKGEPVNLGSGMEISIKDLAEKIRMYTGYKGKIVFDPSKPDGQPRRMLDTTRADNEFAFMATTTFDEGLVKTINWFKENEDFSHNSVS